MHCIVFGATGGIGRPLVQRLLEQDWQVTAVTRRPQDAPSGSMPVGCDLSRRTQVVALARSLPAADRVVFAHGVFTDRPAFAGSEELQHRINATAVRWFCDHAAKPERLVLVGSQAWRRATTACIHRTTGLAAYRASKRALFLYGLQLAARGWQVHTVHPGVVRTPIADEARPWTRLAFRVLRGLVGVDPAQAASTLAHLITEPTLAVPSGTYWDGRTPHPELSAACRDEALGLKWVA